MLAALLLLALAAAPAEEPEPAEPPPGVWVLSGARPWSECQAYEDEAARRLRAGLPRGDERPLIRQWRARVQACPQVPTALVLLARLELASPAGFDPSVELGEGIGALVETHRRQHEEILGWLAAAEREAERRGEAAPPQTAYLMAFASVGLGRRRDAAAHLERARAAGDVEGWRLDTLEAVIRIGDGDLERALRLANRARGHATTSGRTTTTYVLALALDRSGSIAAARSLVAQIRSRESRPLGVLESLLPIHERLYLLALEQEARGHASSAFFIWKAYLERPEVEGPERAQVERRLRELRPEPSLAGS